MKKNNKPALLQVPRMGPPVNLRPAGAHKQDRRMSRARVRETLRRGEDA